MLIANSNFSHLFLKSGGSAEGKKYSRPIVEAPCLPHAPSPQPQDTQPRYPAVRLQGCDTSPGHYSLRGIEPAFLFLMFLFLVLPYDLN